VIRPIAVAAVLAALSLAGCHASSADVTRWETSEDGPEHLAKAVADEGASLEVRRDAGLALVRLERNGRRVGLPMLADALAASNESGRAKVVAAMAPELVAGVGRAPTDSPPAASAGKEGSTAVTSAGPPPDPSLPAKDAVHLLLARGLVKDASVEASLRGSLSSWLRVSLAQRMTDRSQRYSVPEAIRVLGPGSAHGLLTLAGPHGGIERIAPVLREIDGDADRKAHGDELGAMLRGVPWHDREAAAQVNKENHVTVSPEQMEKIVSAYADLGITSILDAMGRLGSFPADAILDVVESPASPAARREKLLGALAAHPEAVDAKATERVFTIATAASTEGSTCEAAFRVVQALPDRAATTPRLWALLPRGGRVRMEAGRVLLTRITTGEVDAFLHAVTAPKVTGAGHQEALEYAPALEKLLGREALRPYTKSRVAAIRAIALPAFADEPATLAASEKDEAELPASADGFDWDCPVGQRAAADDANMSSLMNDLASLSAKPGGQLELVPIDLNAILGGPVPDIQKPAPVTVGTFVCHCLDAARCVHIPIQ
jgi:hypothetical protein